MKLNRVVFTFVPVNYGIKCHIIIGPLCADMFLIKAGGIFTK